MSPADTLIILTPGFATSETDDCLPAQEAFIRAVNANFPDLHVIILSFHYPFNRHTVYEWYGNQVIPFAAEKKGKLRSFWLWLRVWNKLRMLKKTQHIIGLFSFFCSESAFVGHHFARLNGLKHFIWVLGQDARKENKQVGRIRPNPQELVAISDFLVRTFEENNGIRPAHMIPIGINPASFEHATSGRNIDLLGAGSLIPLKQFDLFLHVAKKISGQVPGCRIVICGEGPEKANLLQTIQNMDLEEQVGMTGRLSHADVLKTMQRTKILLHTSAYEGLGAVCLEALYAGAQVISFCRPFDADIPHWHIVEDEDAMVAKALQLLAEEAPAHASVMPFEVNEIAHRIIQLFRTF